MPRPTKRRMICRFPQTLEFIPAADAGNAEAVVMTLDEYETIRLIDKEGLSQEQCSLRMQIARTTAQKIYDSARKKLADALTEGVPLRIGGGEYRICDGMNRFCRAARCYKRKIYQTFQKSKGGGVMRIAVAYEDGGVFQHFGRAEKFKIYDVDDGKIVSSEIVDTNGQGHGALAEVLRALRTDVLICGGIGGGAKAALEAGNIKLYGGVKGGADDAVKALLEGRLNYDPSVRCDRHDKNHSGGTCGNHEGNTCV